MPPKPNALDRLVDEACGAIRQLGLANLTVGVVAERAGVSTALVHYHFDTKARLVVACAQRIGVLRADRRAAALDRKRGLAALDALWDQLLEDAKDGLERAWVELALYARDEPPVGEALATPHEAARRALQRRLPTLIRELGGTIGGDSDELAAALDAQLDGVALALLRGDDPAAVRTAYDAFWLTVLAAAPSRRR